MTSRAVAIQGGGSKGRMSGEVVAQLKEKLGITFEEFFGVSSGGIVSAAVSYLGEREAMQAWSANIHKFHDVFSHRFNFESGFYDQDPLRKLLHKLFDGKEPKIPYTVGTVDWDYGENHYIQCKGNPNAIECILATSAIPILCEPIENRDGLIIPDKIEEGFCDGGTCSVTPLSAAVEKGFDEIFVIMTQPNSRKMEKFTATKFPLFPFIQIAQRAMRALSILMHARMLDDLDWVHFARPDQKIYILAPKSAPWDDCDFSDESQSQMVKTATDMVDEFAKVWQNQSSKDGKPK